MCTTFRQLPVAVVQPGTVEEMQEIAKIAAAANLALVPRGGGASYTDAYLPDREQSLLIDTERLKHIVEINDQDMYVTVEPGVTWAELSGALAEQGLRTPFWGPFSGLKATVGGSTSQNSVSLGSGAYGISADSILSFEIVLANGEILRTGSNAIANGKPFSPLVRTRHDRAFHRRCRHAGYQGEHYAAFDSQTPRRGWLVPSDLKLSAPWRPA